MFVCCVWFSQWLFCASRRRHTSCALVTGVQTCALPIYRGWSLVSDDYVTLECRGGKLVAAPPEKIAGRMEVRHVGLIRLPFITGVPVCLAIFLDRAPERLPDADVWNHAGIAVPAFALHVLEPSAPLKVEHLLRVNGHAVE